MNRIYPRSRAECGNASADAPARSLVPALLLLAAAAGCHKAAPEKEPIEVKPPVRLVKPQKRDLHREVGQPGYVFAYEQTSLFPKVAGYIEQWMVDIGDPLKKGQLLTRIYVPELHARLAEKKALVKLDEVRVRLAEQSVDVSQEQVHVARADVSQAQADIKKYQADVERWSSEVKRLASAKVEGRLVVNEQILAESRRQLELARASRLAAEAALTASQAREKARTVELAKAKVDVEAALAQVKVDEAAEEHLEALVSYTKMHAPYDGVVVVRNANTGDYVEPRYGDESPQLGGIESATSERGTPIYVVARTDVVRVYVDVPEMEANYIDRGTKARVRIQSLNDTEFEGTVTRTSWALNVQSRTLRAEIDLPNKDARVRPGMYAYGEVQIVRRGVFTVPKEAVIEIGNQNTVYLHEDGKAKRAPVQIGISDDKHTEVFRKKEKDKWVEFTGDEEVILGDLPELRDGEEVRISKEKGTEKKESKPNISGKEKR
ncbi:MAG TPA: efflux RND transporter periplasmic adaptor subunit [Gemmataceae bacterium]|nr:efflux RND transporter periplasmic adaptor subunit [Gemmataceae bacterium]